MSSGHARRTGTALTHATAAIFCAALLLAPAAHAQSLTGEIGNTVDQVGGTVGDTVDKVGDTVKDTGGTVGDTVEDTGGTVGDTVGGPVGDAINDTTETVGGAVKDTSGSTSDAINDTTGTIGDVGGNTLDEVTGGGGNGSEQEGTNGAGGGKKASKNGSRTKDTVSGAERAPFPHSPINYGFGAWAEANRVEGLDEIELVGSALDGEEPVDFGILAKQAAQAVQRFAFPILLSVLVIAFILIQGRIDRRDPKLAFATVDREEDLLGFS